MRTYILGAILGIVLFLMAPALADAKTPPDFPACSNPQGTLKVEYNEGIHGIAGETNSYSGSDAVYYIDDENLTQCFCADNGDGIQSNWWKVNSLDEEEIEILKSQGWIYVPSGANWGLDSSAYFVKNSKYECKSDNSNDNGGNTNSSSSSSSGSSSSDSGVGGAVLGLATTGENVVVYTLIGLGFSLLSIGLLLRK